MTVTHPLCVIQQEAVDGHIVGAGGGYILLSYIHRQPSSWVCSGSCRCPIRYCHSRGYEHDVEGVYGRLGIFALADDFTAVASEAVSMGGTMAVTDLPPLVAVMSAAAATQERSPAGDLVPVAYSMAAAADITHSPACLIGGASPWNGD